ncbi:MAG: shikimate kinase [Lachnospiraceae bacterium]|jgi:shikimate kinase|nr:shikimate kinase [Lachnospiraceae bacterium]MBQ5561592.1 shikimate kinase [Lachnospiraceae bacterium]
MDNIVLIGMPGSGKSTLGVVLAKMIGYGFIDSDLIIEEEEGRVLPDIIAQEGIDGFNAIENRVNCSIDCHRKIIATGGSAVYGEEAMKHLGEIGTIVYLKWSLKELATHLGDLEARGVVFRPGQDLKAIYEERCPLYEKYADLIVDCEGDSVEGLVSQIMKAIS